MLRPRLIVAFVVSLVWLPAFGQGAGGLRALCVLDTWPVTGDGVLIGLDAADRPIVLGSGVGGDSVIRAFDRGSFLVVDRRDGRLLRIDRWGRVVSEWVLPAGERLRDALRVSAGEVWITRERTNQVLSLDLATGQFGVVVDLSPVLVGELVADPNMMFRVGGRVFVQLQRLDDEDPFFYEATGAVAVIDMKTRALVDADAVVSGVQAIALEGPLPQHKMHVTPDGETLLVSATGGIYMHQFVGGIQRIDLATLATDGFAVAEDSGDLTGFAPTDGALGVGMFHTDIIAAGHVYTFDVTAPPSGMTPQFDELFVTVELVVYDRERDRVLIPGIDAGLNFFDPSTGARTRITLLASSGPAGTGGLVRDLAILPRGVGAAPRTNDDARMHGLPVGR